MRQVGSVGYGSQVAAGEGGQGGIEDQDAVAGHEQDSRQQHLLGDRLGGVLEGGGLFEAQRCGLGVEGVAEARPSPAWAMAMARSAIRAR